MDEAAAQALLEQLLAAGDLTPQELELVRRKLESQGQTATPSSVVASLMASGRLSGQTPEELASTAPTQRVGPTRAAGHEELSPFGERFADVQPLGSGGMGSVYRAWDNLLQRPVAIKVLRHANAMPALLAEARAQAKIDHDHVCPVYDVVEKEGKGFVVMRLVAGESLAAFIGKLSPREVASLGAQVARALHAAHRQGLLHRDVKPANILVEKGDQGLKACVVDFGLSWAGEGEVAGTPGYLPPESVGVGKTDARGDVFALGATLYCLLAGKPPQSGQSLLEVVATLSEGRWQPPAMPDPPFPEDLACILRKALAPDPEARYATALELAEDLERFLRDEPVLAHAPGFFYRFRKAWVRAGWWGALLALALVAGLGAVASAVWVVVRGKHQERLTGELQVRLLELENQFRSAFTKPQHNVRPELERWQRDVEEAAARARQAGLDQESLLVLLGRVYVGLGQSEKALALLSAPNKGQPSPARQEVLALALLQRWQEEWDQVAQLPAGEVRKSRAQAIAARYRDRALELLGHAQGSSRGKFSAAQLALLEGRWEEAAQLALAARGETPWVYELERLAGRAHLGLGRDAFDRGRYAEALESFREAETRFRQALAFAPSYPLAYLDLAQVLVEKGNAAMETGGDVEKPWREAAKVAEEALAVDPEEARALYLLAMSHLKLGDYFYRYGREGEALAEFAAMGRWAEALEAKAPHRSWGSTFQGVALRLEAELRWREDVSELERRAREKLEKALSLDSTDTLAGNNLGLLYWQQALAAFRRGQLPGAELSRAQEIFQRLLASFSSNTLRDNLGAVVCTGAHVALFFFQDPAKVDDVGEEVLRAAVAANPADTVALNNLLLLRLERAQYRLLLGLSANQLLDEAEDLLARVREVNPVEPMLPDNALRLLALRLQAVSRMTEAKPLFDAARSSRERVTDWDSNAEARVWWAAILGEMARLEGRSAGKSALQAETTLKQALQLAPNYPDGLLLWASWRLASKRGVSAQERELIQKLADSPFPLLRELGARLARGAFARPSQRGFLWGLVEDPEKRSALELGDQPPAAPSSSGDPPRRVSPP
ncbi:MAG: protein kinase domain-containing protein [Thermoanaerobaculum sp.]